MHHALKADFLCFVHCEVRNQSADNYTNAANVVNLDEKRQALSLYLSIILYLSLHTMREKNTHNSQTGTS